MTLARRIAIFLALLALSAAAFAQLPTAGNVFIGYSLNHADAGWGTKGNLNGWVLSAEGRVAPHVGMVVDLGSTYGTLPIPTSVLFGQQTGNTDAQSRVATYLFGPRVSMSYKKIRPFAHVLVGAAHLHQDTSQYAAAYTYGETALADAFGGGVDYKVLPHIALRGQVDDIQTRFHSGVPTKAPRRDDIRVSTGVVFRF